MPNSTQASQADVALSRAKDRLKGSTNSAVALRNLETIGLNSPFTQRRPNVRQNLARPLSPPAVTIPNPLTLGTKSKPDDPIQCQHQLNMLKAFDSAGRHGLEVAIYKEAKLHTGAGISWSYIIADYEDPEKGRVYQLLSLLPGSIIRSLIKNTIAYDYLNDQKVKRFINDSMRADLLSPRAGIYTNVIRDLPTVISNGNIVLTKDAGKGLSSKQAASLIRVVRNYDADKPADVQTNLAIDNLFSLWANNMGRRHGIRLGYESRLETWLSVLQAQSCTGTSPSEMDTPFVRCLFEVGWAQDIQKRLKEHLKHHGTTSLFAYTHAYTHAFTRRYPAPLQLILFPIWEDDRHLKKVAEVLGSMLCSSYWLWGGLNYYEAGYSTTTTKGPDDDVWFNSQKDVIRRLTLGKYADEDNELAVRRAEAAREMMMEGELEVSISELKNEAEKEMEKLRIAKAKHTAAANSLREAREEQRKRNDEMSGRSNAGLKRMAEARKILANRRQIDEAAALVLKMTLANRRGDTELTLMLRKELERYSKEQINLALDSLEEETGDH